MGRLLFFLIALAAVVALLVYMGILDVTPEGEAVLDNAQQAVGDALQKTGDAIQDAGAEVQGE